VGDAREVPRGTLRITADPVFGEAFLGDLVIDFARRWPEVKVELLLTRRRVDLIEEGFDVAFRIGRVDDGALAGVALGPARVRYCASPGYLARRGAPRGPADLAAHDLLVVHDGGPARWPFPGARGLELVPVTGRLVLSSFAMAHAAAVAGLGIALFPEFACAADLRARRLVPLLTRAPIDVGSVWLLHAARRMTSARVRAFAELARRRLARVPWAPARRGRRT
jgi:DNA-binding transcriptional LysR family regulator